MYMFFVLLLEIVVLVVYIVLEELGNIVDIGFWVEKSNFIVFVDIVDVEVCLIIFLCWLE